MERKRDNKGKFVKVVQSQTIDYFYKFMHLLIMLLGSYSLLVVILNRWDRIVVIFENLNKFLFVKETKKGL